MKRYYTDKYGNNWVEMNSKAFPDVRIKMILPKEEEE